MTPGDQADRAANRLRHAGARALGDRVHLPVPVAEAQRGGELLADRLDLLARRIRARRVAGALGVLLVRAERLERLAVRALRALVEDGIRARAARAGVVEGT